MEYSIRPAEPKDVNAVYRFICELEDVNFGKIPFEKIFNKNIENPDFIYLVAQSGSNFVGFISCHTQLLLNQCGRVAEIQELFIDPAYRGFRIGHKLLAALEKAVIQMKCISLEVTAKLIRIPSQLFYEKKGFVFTHKKFVKQLGQSISP